MSITESQYKKVLTRLTAIENHLNNVTIALDRYVELSQVQQLLVVIQTSLDDITMRLESLETRVEIIENDPLI
jgi:tetrahydromethanopterin S-methyltransferase subunit G